MRNLGAFTAAFLICVIGGCLLALAVMAGDRVMCSLYDGQLQSCPGYGAQK